MVEMAEDKGTSLLGIGEIETNTLILLNRTVTGQWIIVARTRKIKTKVKSNKPCKHTHQSRFLKLNPTVIICKMYIQGSFNLRYFPI